MPDMDEAMLEAGDGDGDVDGNVHVNGAVGVDIDIKPELVPDEATLFPADRQQDGDVPNQEHHSGAPADQPASPRQSVHFRPSITSADELQLAAQLSQDLSQGMPTILDDPNPPSHDQSLEHQDPQQPLHDSHLEHDSISEQPSLAQPDPEIPQHHDEDQHSFLSDQQSREPPHHQFAQAHGALDHLARQYAQALPDSTPPRKRSKVSRACDECRRKKVKCDAASETGDQPCSNCRRSNTRCLFSRIPQKRGPSKGYIKELADRIHSIEGKLASEGGNVDSLSELLAVGARRDSADIFASDDSSRKRPYASISAPDLATPSTPRPIQPYQPPRPNAAYSANGLAPQPLAKPDTATATRPMPVIDTISLDLEQSAPIRELDDDAFTGYLNVVHPCYPLLASNKSRVEAQLVQCPPPLRDAFVEALYWTMQSFVSAPGLYTTGDVASAARLLNEWESDPSLRTPIMNLVHLQTLVLTAIATDNYGPPSLKGEHGGAPKASILGRAVGLAYSMRLHLSGLQQVDGHDGSDHDSDDNVATRTWWTLIMLDRWHAIGTASPLFIPNDSVVVLPSLNVLLGDGAYHLARLSNILGHFAPVSLIPPQTLDAASGTAPILSSFFNLSIELFRQALPTNITPAEHPVLHLVYWHSRLLAYLFQTNSKSSDILWPCRETASLLLTNTHVLSPMNHHFFCLTTLCLVELAQLDRTRDEASMLLKDLRDSNLAPSTWDDVIRRRIGDDIGTNTSADVSPVEITANQSLQHLADLATATVLKPEKEMGLDTEPITLRTSSNHGDVGFDPRPLTRLGYLNVLAGAAS